MEEKKQVKSDRRNQEKKRKCYTPCNIFGPYVFILS